MYVNPNRVKAIVQAQTVRTECREYVAHLDGDVPATDDAEPSGHLVETHDRVAGVEPGLDQAGDGRDGRPRSGRHEDVGCRQPASLDVEVDLVRRARGRDTIEGALELEYRFTARAMEHGDFLEGIRAAIIDKDKAPKWRHARPEDVTPAEVSAMLRPLGVDELKLEENA